MLPALSVRDGKVKMPSNVLHLSDKIKIAAARNPRGLAFILEGEKKITFGVLNAQICRIAETLRTLGAQSGHRIGFASPRSYLGIAGCLGISDVAICCPISPRLSEQEFVNVFTKLSISVLVTGVDAASAVRAAEKVSLPIVTMEVIDEKLLLKTSANRVLKEATAPQTDGDRIAILMQTSGTTSQAKIVQLTHKNILASTEAIVREFGIEPGDLCLNPMPLHHVHGLISAGISSLLGASTAICLPLFSPKLFASVYESRKPTWFTGSPAMHIALLEHYRRSSIAPTNSRLRFLRSSSAPLPVAIIPHLEQLFGAPVIDSYGLTEAASMVTTNPLPPAIRKMGSVGRPINGEVRILTDEGLVASPNVEGEIAIRGPSVIREYGEIGELNSHYFVGDWLRTGDLGRVDEDGYCFITGRKKELIKRGGLSVYPNEIESTVAAYPGVGEAVIFSIPHPTLGEEIIAAVVPVNGGSLDGDALRDAMLGSLPAYKVPAKILVLKNIPKSETGKILRRSMAEKLAHLLQPANEPPKDWLEQKLLAVWRDVLSRNDIGVTDNVFVCGADPPRSNLAKELLTQTCTSLSLSAREMFSAPTVRQQAAILRSRASHATI